MKRHLARVYEIRPQDGRIKSGLFRFICFISVLTALSGPVGAQPAHRLVVISVDGFDARFLNEPSLHVKIPNIRKLVRNGASASVISVAPSTSRATNFSIVTGVAPDQSGDRPESTTLWAAAEKAGLKVASVFWPTDSAPGLTYNFPESMNAVNGNGVPFDAIAEKSSPAGVVNLVEAMFPRFQKDLWDDSSSAQAAAYILATSAPDLLLVHFSDVEAEQRVTGALTIYARDALENDDDLIGQVVTKIPKGTIVAVVSGHGVENANYVVRPRVLLKRSGQSQKVEVADGLIGVTDSAVAERLRTLMRDQHQHGIAREVPITEVRARTPWHTSWVAAFDTPQNYFASNEDQGPALGPGTHRGVSGFWPGRPGYRSVFVIAGEGIQSRKLREIELLEIAPTLGDAIGISLTQTRMRSLLSSLYR